MLASAATSFACCQAKSALLFLYKEVLALELPWLNNIKQSKVPKRLPVVLNREEVQAVLSRLSGTHWLVASLLYGTGMRIMECLRLRVKDVDFNRREILIRDGKGFKDRVTMLPVSLATSLETHLAKVRGLHQTDLQQGYGAVYLPNALEKNIPMRQGSGDGSMRFRLQNYRPILAAVRYAATMSRINPFSVPSNRRRVMLI